MKRRAPTRLQNRLAWRRKAARFTALGLTTRGTVRKVKQWSLVEHGPQRKRVRDRWYQVARLGAMIPMKQWRLEEALRFKVSDTAIAHRIVIGKYPQTIRRVNRRVVFVKV